VLDSLFGANIFQKVTRMCKDRFAAVSTVVESRMINTYLIARRTCQAKIYGLAIIEPIILGGKVIDAG